MAPLRDRWIAAVHDNLRDLARVLSFDMANGPQDRPGSPWRRQVLDCVWRGLWGRVLSVRVASPPRQSRLPNHPRQLRPQQGRDSRGGRDASTVFWNHNSDVCFVTFVLEEDLVKGNGVTVHQAKLDQSRRVQSRRPGRLIWMAFLPPLPKHLQQCRQSRCWNTMTRMTRRK
jgi:hypothetical protein